MSIYNFNIKPVAIELLPPDKRYLKNINFIQSLLSALQWVRDLFFGSYYEGPTAPNYAPGTYSYLQQVIYNKKVYSSNIDNNTDLPTTSNWTLVQDNFIGLKERILYCGQKIILEYALNKEFGGTFRQPQTPSGIGDTLSDIYIVNLSYSIVGFLIGQTEEYCSSIGKSTSSDPIGSDSPFVYLDNFTIFIPTLLLDVSIDANEKAVRNFVNQYMAASLNYTIQNY